jgi:hypothetical protein
MKLMMLNLKRKFALLAVLFALAAPTLSGGGVYTNPLDDLPNSYPQACGNTVCPD